MFTGLVSHLGVVQKIAATGEFYRVELAGAGLSASPLELGESIAVNGCCLTVVEQNADIFAVDVSPETARLTTLGALVAGSAVNLERSMPATGRFGGHFVTGHVDAVGRVATRAEIGLGLTIKVAVPDTLLKFIAAKGSITVDGVSLTVNAVDERGFEVMIIPHTRKQTIIEHYQVGTPVNIEVDILARYMERALSFLGRAPARDEKGITRDWLKGYGYL